MASTPKNPPNPREVLERNLARARRRLGNTSTMINGRQFAVAVDGTVITFECKRARHRYKIDFGSKRRRLTARLSPDACKFQASWWSVERGKGRLHRRLSPVREGCEGHEGEQNPVSEENPTKHPTRDELAAMTYDEWLAYHRAQPGGWLTTSAPDELLARCTTPIDGCLSPIGGCLFCGKRCGVPWPYLRNARENDGQTASTPWARAGARSGESLRIP